VHTSIDLDTKASRIAQLEIQLRVAEERATIAEEQLRRVHVAVRAFKQKQLRARASQQQAEQRGAAQAVQVESSEQFASWGESDPTLDDRLDEYLRADFEPDSSRDWMLRE